MNYTKLSLNIILVFVIAMFASLVPEYLSELFGDWFCEGSYRVDSNHNIIGCSYGLHEGTHNPEWHWGWRHWLWMFMSIALFIVQVVRIVSQIINPKK